MLKWRPSSPWLVYKMILKQPFQISICQYVLIFEWLQLLHLVWLHSMIWKHEYSMDELYFLFQQVEVVDDACIDWKMVFKESNECQSYDGDSKLVTFLLVRHQYRWHGLTVNERVLRKGRQLYSLEFAIIPEGQYRGNFVQPCLWTKTKNN